MNKLMLGSGRGSRKAAQDGWHTIDVYKEYGPTWACVLPPLPPGALQMEWDYIESSHFMEHLYPSDAKVLMRQVYMVLKPGGMVVHELPNIEFCMKVALGMIDVSGQRKPDFLGMTGIFGEERPGDPYYSHRWGYSPETMTQLLVDSGFSRDKIEIKPATKHRPIRDFRVEATK